MKLKLSLLLMQKKIPLSIIWGTAESNWWLFLPFFVYEKFHLSGEILKNYGPVNTKKYCLLM